MPDEDVAKHQKEDVIGHRPTWFVGVNSSARKRAAFTERRNGFSWRFATQDPFGLFGAGQAGESKPKAEPERPLRRAERKCLRQLSLEEGASKAEIKARFKDLVKRHHPDLNRGDRRSEDKLREVIQAYNYLRQAGLA
jgi:DnaJ-domain-containing protein 1